jgi:hypothetical protein
MKPFVGCWDFANFPFEDQIMQLWGLLVVGTSHSCNAKKVELDAI